MTIAFQSEAEIVSAGASDGQSDAAGRTLLSLVIPVRDAAGSLPATLNAITRWIAASNIGVDVIVVDDGSSDGTRATASSFGRRIANLQVLRHVERRGRLEAIRTGERAARGESIAFGRAIDLERSLEVLPELIAALDHAEVAVLHDPPGRPLTPVHRAPAPSLKSSCFGWLRKKIARAVREPELVVCRATALRAMVAAARPGENPDPDWLSLARRARRAIRTVRRGSPEALPRLQSAQSA